MNSIRHVSNRYVAILVLLAVFAGCGTKSDSASKSDATPVTAQPRDSVTIMLRAGDSTTAFDLLKSSHQVDYQSTAIGVFVKGIDSIYSSSDAFWVYSVNDSLPEIASDKFSVRAGDIVHWYLRKAKP